jgi:plasmid replication initiation protein
LTKVPERTIVDLTIVLLGAIMAKLLRRKHAQRDLFICDILDATPKDDIGSMEHPFFSLSKKPDNRTIKKYEHNGEYIKIAPSVYGMATIFDKDILIFAMSQIMAKINEGEEPSQTIQFSAYDLLVTTERATSGAQYERLKSAFLRLEGTRIETCMRTGGKEITKGFGLIEYWDIIRETRDGRMEGLELKISDWLYNAILAKEVLTINPDYFRLGKPLERRVYEICRKFCGHQSKWRIGLEPLKKKTGSSSSLKKFREFIKDIIESDHIPDYQIYFDEDKKDLLIVRPRVTPKPAIEHHKPFLKPQTYENAEKILRPRGLDKYAVESEWRDWIEGQAPPKTPDGAFIGFCNMKVANL